MIGLAPVKESDISPLDLVPADMLAELQRFDALCEQVIASFVGAIEAQPPPQYVYHYTNAAGLKGILESGTIWLSDIFSLNDPSELGHGFSQAVAILNAMAASGPPESKLFAEQFEAFLTQGGIQAAAHFFAGSFSANGDDLGQWRAYADNGRGYALEFNTQALEDGYTKKDGLSLPNNSTFPVTYDDARLGAIYRALIEAAFPLISAPRGRNLGSAVIIAYMRELSVLTAMHALRAALFFKHEAYRNEQEYRFLQLFRANAEPAVSTRGHVKYRKYDWRSAAPVALTRVVVGPAADKERAIQFARDCSASAHVGQVDVVVSKIPYRS